MWAFIGDICLRLGDRPGALRAFDHALGVSPRLFNADDLLFSRGTLLMSQQEHWEHRHPDAEADLRAVLASQPDHANAAFNLGLLLGQTEEKARVSEAVPFLQRALTLADEAEEERDDLDKRRHALGVALLQLGRRTEATALLIYPHWAPGQSSTGSSGGGTAWAGAFDLHGLELEADGDGASDNEFLHARTLRGVLTPNDCAALVGVAEVYAASHGGWTRARHEAFPTTDLPLSALPQDTPSVAHAVNALREAVLPAMVQAYPSLAQLSLYVADVFVAKYVGGDGSGSDLSGGGHGGGQGGGGRAVAGKSGRAQRMLAFHSDGTPLSFICTLAVPRQGGGTVFRALLPPDVAAGIGAGDATSGFDYGPGNRSVFVTAVGDCLIFPGGALLHGGVPVIAGVRDLLIGFVGVGRFDSDAADKGAGGASSYKDYRDLWSATKHADQSRSDRTS